MKTIHVSTHGELVAALRGATGGETILLAGGDYGTLALTPNARIPAVFPATVTIAAADPGKPPVFSALDLRGAANIAFDGITFDYVATPDSPIWAKPFKVWASENIAFRNCVFDGDIAQGTGTAADGYATGFGLNVSNTRGFVLENSKIETFFRGITVGNSDDVMVRGNEITGLRMDGMNFAATQRVTIEDNHIHSFRRSPDPGDHADMIQFWTNGTTRPSTDIVIRNNLLDIGGGDATQSIFMRNDQVDRGLAGEEMFYRNVLIEGNTIYNAHMHGIALGATAGAVIRDNAVLYADPGRTGTEPPRPVEVPRIAVAANATDVVITGNVTSRLGGHEGQAGWTVDGNAFVQPVDPRAPGFYESVFVSSTLGLGEGGGHAYLALPGGLIGQMGVGPAGLHRAVEGLHAAFDVSAVPGNTAMRILDAGVSSYGGQPLPEGTRYLWTFSDGTTAEGRRIEHPFPEGGEHAAILTVVLPRGGAQSQTLRFMTPGSDLVTLGSGGITLDAFGAGTLVTPLAGPAIVLGAGGPAASIERQHLAPLADAESFAIDLTLAASTAGAAGEVMRLQGAFTVSVSRPGDMLVRLFTEAGEVRLTTKGVALNDLAARDVQIRLEDGRLSVTVDGIERGAAEVTAPVSFKGTGALQFGNPPTGTPFAGTISAFEIDIDMADHAAALQMRDAMPRERPAVLAWPDAAAPEPQFAATGSFLTEDADEVSLMDADAAGPAAPPLAFDAAVLDRFVLDIDALAANAATAGPRLVADATVADGPGGRVVRLDGQDDHVVLGRVAALENADRIGFSVAFTQDADGGSGTQRLVWNHLKLGATLTGSAVQVQVATASEGFKTFTIRDAGITPGAETRLTVLLDTAEDRLQVLIDDRVALDHRETDFDLSGGRESGWMLGTPWNRFFAGEISDFRLGDRFEFLDGPGPDLWIA